MSFMRFMVNFPVFRIQPPHVRIVSADDTHQKNGVGAFGAHPAREFADQGKIPKRLFRMTLFASRELPTNRKRAKTKKEKRGGCGLGDGCDGSVDRKQSTVDTIVSVIRGSSTTR